MRKLLHIYAQPFEHGEAWVVGTREGLEELRNALNRVLAVASPWPFDTIPRDTSTSLDAETTDGEGYKTLIVVVDEKQLLESDTLLPYTDCDYISGKPPVELIGMEKYRTLMRHKD